MSKVGTKRLPRHEELAVAVQASADPRTVRKVVAGKPVRGVVRSRIERVLRQLRILPNEGGQP
jgi:hypothetical protein